MSFEAAPIAADRINPQPGSAHKIRGLANYSLLRGSRSAAAIPRCAHLQRMIIARLLIASPGRFLSIALIAADLPVERAPKTIKHSLDRLKRFTETRRGIGGGYRLSPEGRASLKTAEREE